MSGPDPLLGTRIGSIRLDSRLGAGAMGVVYRGHHEVLAKDVAVKLLANAKVNDAHARERFLREARAAAKISHPNVVSVFEAGIHDGAPYLVMELVVGHSLGSLLDELGRKHGKPTGLPHASVSRLGAGIALGIAAIHAAGVVHRDIKPDNVMVAADRTPKIADLGLAKEVADPDAQRLTGTGMVVGTPLYCAPEAIRDPQSIGPAADVYCLGATLYHMLAGRPPFLGSTAYEVMRAHLEDRPKPLREVVAGIPAVLSGLVDLCLEKDARLRPSALQVAEALGSGVALKARPRFGAALVATLAAVAVLGGGGAAWWWLAPRPAVSVPVATTAQITLLCAHPRLRARVDDGAWQAIGPEGLGVRPGRHRLAVEADQPGPTLRWTGEAETTAAGRSEVAVVLAAVPVPETALELPGAGMLYRNGEAFSTTEQSVRVAQAGIWALGRWDGRSRWTTRTYVIDLQGKVSAAPARDADRPGGDAWWRSSGDDGMPLAKHHVVCWFEADKARESAGISDPPAWREQGSQPAQPPLGIDASLVQGVVDRLGEAAVPERDVAAAFSVRLHHPVWYRDARARLSLVGGGSEQASGWLVLVPPAGTGEAR